ncbi:MAG: thioredoxin [Propionibacteriaceae bacterium]|jgi:thioredoxin 1|nr:thioredoxin [Propionibacteriaceae bacterium]
MSNTLAVTDATFSAEVLNADTPVVVDYWADWCAPCRQLSPIIDELAGQYPDVKFVKVDTNVETGTAAAQDVRTLPTVQVFAAGEVVTQFVGSVTKMKLREAIESLG